MRKRIRYARKARAPANRYLYKAGGAWGKGTVTNARSARRPFGKTYDTNTHIDGSLQMINRSFFPNRMVCTHRYVGTHTLANANISGLTGTEQIYRLGDLYDPDFSGTGHQPWGYDQMNSLYGQFQVFKVKIQIRILEASGTGPYIAVCVVPWATSTTYNVANKFYREIIERAGTTCIYGKTAASTATVDKAFEKTFYLADIEGLSRREYMDDVAYKGINATPPKFPWLKIAAGSINETLGASITVSVAIEYSAIWTSPNVPSES